MHVLTFELIHSSNSHHVKFHVQAHINVFFLKVYVHQLARICKEKREKGEEDEVLIIWKLTCIW